jgi:hypothetical protein
VAHGANPAARHPAGGAGGRVAVHAIAQHIIHVESRKPHPLRADGMLQGVHHFLDAFADLKSFLVGDGADPFGLQLPQRPQRRIGVHEKILFDIVLGKGQQRIEELFVLKEPFPS